MLSGLIKEFLVRGLPTVTTALGTMWAYDKRNSIKWAALGGFVGWGAGYALRGLALRVIDRDVALPAVVAPALLPAHSEEAPPGPPDNVVSLNAVKEAPK